jgi:hypothetical protein
MEKLNFEQVKREMPKRDFYEKLKKATMDLSEILNKKFKEEFGGNKTGNLLDDECRICPKAFMKGRRQGPYDEEDVKFDEQKIANKESNELAIDPENENVKKHYESLGARSRDEILTMFKEEKKRSNWHLLEMLTPILLYKFLPEKFVAVKTSKYDDYENGVDNLIVNKETGEVICTIDDLSAATGSKRDLTKQKKALHKTMRGGASVKYGITYEGGRLKKQEIKNIPAFNLRLSSDAVKSLLTKMSFDLEVKEEKEKETVLDIIDDFIKQTEFLLENNINEKMKMKIENFKIMLGKWRDKIIMQIQ